MVKLGEKKKISILTIILLILTIFLIWFAYDWNQIKERVWDRCDNLFYVMTAQIGYNETAFNDYFDCRDDYDVVLNRFYLWGAIAAGFIFLTVISLRVDKLNKK